jgi:glycosyltransferase involved in cell wall biosynthesis
MELNGLPRELLFHGGTEDEVRAATERMKRHAAEVTAGIGVSESIREFMEEEVGIVRTWCIPNGSDPCLFRPSAKDRDKRAPLEVVWMGSLKFGWHDIDTLLSAADLLEAKRADVRFTIYGDRKALPGKLPGNVGCVGRVSYEQLGQRLGRADVGLHLFKSLNGHMVDGSPLKFFDYMACGLAVITRDAGQVAEIIRNSGVGLTTTGTTEDLADKITHLSEDRSLCAELGVNGRRAVEEYYNWGRVAGETEEILRQVTEC